MLKTVSSVANALGALNYKGTWDAATNTPTLASGVGTQGDYYVVSVAGTTDLDGITNWGVGDWAAFNGSVWQRVEGGADGNFVNLTATGLSTLNEVQVDSININDDTVGFYRDDPTIFVGNQLGVVQWGGADGGNTSNAAIKVVAGSSNWAPTSTPTDIQFWTTDVGSDTARKVITVDENGNLVFANAGNGIDFSATSQAPGSTSELFDDYEEGSWDMVLTSASGSFTTATLDPNATAFYTKIGRHVFIQGYFMTDAITAGTASGDIYISLPFAVAALTGFGDQGVGATGTALSWGGDFPFAVSPRGGDTKMNIHYRTSANGSTSNMQVGDLATGANSNVMVFTAQYIAA
jgi:hypothetical protein